MAKKVLIVVTGRGLGGDAGIALNVYKALTKRGMECEIALDESAPGILFKKNKVQKKIKIQFQNYVLEIIVFTIQNIK